MKSKKVVCCIKYYYLVTAFCSNSITCSFPIRTCIKVATKIIIISLVTMFNASSWVIKEIVANSLNFIAERCNCCWCCYLIFWLVQFHFSTTNCCDPTIWTKDFRALGVAMVRRMTAATAANAAITLVCLFVEMLFFVLGWLHPGCVLSNKIELHRWELNVKLWWMMNFQKKSWIFYLFMLKVISSEKYSVQSYQNRNL